MQKEIVNRELNYRTSRSSGSGGQHVNKTETRVELLFDVQASAGLSPVEKRRAAKALANRINSDGILQVDSSNSRSQLLNRKAATRKFFRLLEKALQPPKPRKGPSPLRADNRKRLQNKKRRSDKKALRGKVQFPD
ncbi:alternative ribosome rescue aminoacyl-tRNA hydrolase ArfB [Phaeodactylibacter luteus]|uniref:Aminoacyl-tRNA hydrolase n=1 Tax=Phaeodactylibacter luteus TaxID=1564516 RepID=A0A5C6RL74_9BACT|nr:alternative ribosome rescue aminoacyl-tRNA hydrolase ArfB [Phaeodactylibacter luteus]TXB62704.1 aminoacyl-tRNA hydrolase [Phaeodactylibacter luteus]